MDSKQTWHPGLEHAALSDVGMRRSNNQDASAVVLASDGESWRRRGHIFVVADGMGAHAAGELASKLAAERIPFNYHKLAEATPIEALRKSVREANTEIHRRGQANAEFHGMGTTASVVTLLPQGALIAHVGDSRVYRLRGTTLEQLTFDHSLVWEMSAAGQLPKEDLPNVIPKNIITRSLGPHPEVQVDLEGPFPVELGDTFLLCSDGLSGQVKDEEIGMILECLPPQEAARVLVDLANLRGGPDNITVVVTRVTGRGITAAAGGGEPLPVVEDLSSVRAGNRMQMVMYVVAAICLVAGVVLFSSGFAVPGAVSAVAAVVMMAMGLLQKFSPETPEMKYLAPGAMLGKGPHMRVECKPNAEFVEQLDRLVDQLRDAATAENWAIDWSKFNTHAKQAAAAAEKRDWPAAVRDYARAMRSMMHELRNQRLKQKLPSEEDDGSVLGN
jgi:protein phosphatase